MLQRLRQYTWRVCVHGKCTAQPWPGRKEGFALGVTEAAPVRLAGLCTWNMHCPTLDRLETQCGGSNKGMGVGCM